jgi:hypothetical protein
MRAKAFEADRELKELAAEVSRLRVKGRKLRLPDDLKMRICRLWKSGVTFAKIRKATDIQGVTIRSWAEKIDKPRQKRSFRILNVVSDLPESGENPSSLSSSKETPLVFRYGQGLATLEVLPSQLNPELMRILALC